MCRIKRKRLSVLVEAQLVTDKATTHKRLPQLGPVKVYSQGKAAIVRCSEKLVRGLQPLHPNTQLILDPANSPVQEPAGSPTQEPASNPAVMLADIPATTTQKDCCVKTAPIDFCIEERFFKASPPF